MGICCIPCTQHPTRHVEVEAWHLTTDPRTDDSQQVAVRGQPKQRPRCRKRCICLFVILVVVVAFFWMDNLKELNLITFHITFSTSNASVAAQDKYFVENPHVKYFVEYPHEYHFILDEPEKCQQQKPFLVLMVPVAPYNREARDAVRSTWGSERRVKGKRVLLFFLLALPSGDGMEQLQEKVLQESKEHQDLLQSDFIDCYNNPDHQ
ncbi:hypothetical protein UPYG_G00091330, partial [Umbra pygmaea]